MRSKILSSFIFRIVSHPALVLGTVAAILISGDNSGGIYLMFWVMNLLTARPFALVGALGLVFLFWSFLISDKPGTGFSQYIFNIVGMLFVQLSVVLFLWYLPWENSYQTYQGLCLLSLMLAAICSFAFQTRNVLLLLSERRLTGQSQ